MVSDDDDDDDDNDDDDDDDDGELTMMLTMLMLTCRDWSQLGEHRRRLLSQEFSRRSQGHLIEITRSPDGHRNHSYHHNCNHYHKGT